MSENAREYAANYRKPPVHTDGVPAVTRHQPNAQTKPCAESCGRRDRRFERWIERNEVVRAIEAHLCASERSLKIETALAW